LWISVIVVGKWSTGSGLRQCAVQPVSVVVLFVLGERCCGVPLIGDQDPVEEFAANGADEAFGDRVGPRCLNRRLDHVDADRGEDGVEGGGELGVAIPDEEPEAAAGVVEIHDEVASQLGEPGAGDTKDVHTPGGVLDDEERIQPVQGDGVEMEQVTGQDWPCLRTQKLSPGRSGSTSRWVDPGCMQDLPDRGGADPIAQTGELAMDTAVEDRGCVCSFGHPQPGR
jgi:hypothetical protein